MHDDDTTTVPPRPPPSSHRPRAGAAAPARPTSLGLGFILGLGLLFAWLRRHGPPAGAGRPRRLAVLPFENMGGAEDEYFADGMTDEVRGKLAALPGLQVTASSSSASTRERQDAQQIGQELGVDYLLSGRCGGRRATAPTGCG